VSLLLGWAIFMSPNLTVMLHLFTQMFGWGGVGSSQQLQATFYQPATPVLLIALALAFSRFAEAADLAKSTVSRRALFAVVLGILMIMGIFFLGQKTDFIYAQF